MPEPLAKPAVNGYDGILTIDLHLPEIDGMGRFRMAVEALRGLGF